MVLKTYRDDDDGSIWFVGLGGKLYPTEESALTAIREDRVSRFLIKYGFDGCDEFDVGAAAKALLRLPQEEVFELLDLERESAKAAHVI